MAITQLKYNDYDQHIPAIGDFDFVSSGLVFLPSGLVFVAVGLGFVVTGLVFVVVVAAEPNRGFGAQDAVADGFLALKVRRAYV